MPKLNDTERTEKLGKLKEDFKVKLKKLKITIPEIACMAEVPISTTVRALSYKKTNVTLLLFIELCDALGYELVLERVKSPKRRITDPVQIEKLRTHKLKKKNVKRKRAGKKPSTGIDYRIAGVKRQYIRKQPRIYSRKEQLRALQEETHILRPDAGSEQSP